MPDLPPDPWPVRRVTGRGPCPGCGEASFGFLTIEETAERVRITRVAEYHRPDCPALDHGAYVIAVMPTGHADLTAWLLREDELHDDPPSCGCGGNHWVCPGPEGSDAPSA